jgi:NAD(P)-dependent dehydrogenase (short-subunit alcohol dehydrogenase family)
MMKTQEDGQLVGPGADLTGRTALVTGAGRGIGRAISCSLARAGAAVVLTSRTSMELAETADLIASSGGLAATVQADVTDRDQVEELHRAALQLTGQVDIVVNNAGNLIPKPFVELPADERPRPLPPPLSYEDWRSSHAVHLDAAFLVLQAFAPDMLARRHGRVVNIVSTALGRTVGFTSAYDSAKAALAQLTRSLAFEWARYGVTVNAIAAGQFSTRMSAQLHETESGRAWLKKRIPMRRVGDLDEIGRLAVVLAGDDMAFLTGQVIALDGGETL